MLLVLHKLNIKSYSLPDILIPKEDSLLSTVLLDTPSIAPISGTLKSFSTRNANCSSFISKEGLPRRRLDSVLLFILLVSQSHSLSRSLKMRSTCPREETIASGNPSPTITRLRHSNRRTKLLMSSVFSTLSVLVIALSITLKMY